MADVDKHFQPANSPIATRQRVKNSFDFDGSQERNSVDLSKIRNFSFNSGQGGTLTLGGTANGNGYFQIKDSSGSVIVTGDNTGITVYNGNIVVKNASNTTIIDTKGIVSTANFVVDQVNSSLGGTTASSSYTDLSGASLGPFVLTRATTVLITALTSGYNVQRAFDTSDSNQVRVLDSIDGGLIGYSHNGSWIVSNIDFVGQSYGLDVAGDVIAVSAYEQLSAGTHTIKMQHKVLTAGTSTITSYVLSYSILGS